MSSALNDADNEGFERILYIQDDCQIVRPVTAEILAGYETIFQANPKIVQILPLFFKGFLPELGSKYLIDRNLQCYFDPSYGICDLGITHDSAVSLSGSQANADWSDARRAYDGRAMDGLAAWLPHIPFRGW